MAQLKTKKLSTKGTLTITENDTNIFLDNTKVYSKYVVVGVWGQSNAVGYDESFLTKFDIPVDEVRIFQYSDSLKPLTFCAENLQNMNTISPRNGTASEMSSTRAANDSYTVEGRTTYVKTKGIHLPLANLICSVIPEDYGVIIVPGAYGGKGIAEFIKTASSGYYTEFVRRLNAALALHEDNIFGGIVWCQGENNTGVMSAIDYITYFSQIIANLHTDILTGNEKKMPKVTDPKDYWFAFEFPARFKALDSTGILDAQKIYLGDSNYIEIPNETPYNTTLYTSQYGDAHYAGDSFRTIIAPRVFAKMSAAGMFNTCSVETIEQVVPVEPVEDLTELVSPSGNYSDATGQQILLDKQHLKSGKIKSIKIKMGSNVNNNVYLGIFQPVGQNADDGDFSTYTKLGVSTKAEVCTSNEYTTWEFNNVLISERRPIELCFMSAETGTSGNRAIQMKCTGRPTGDLTSRIKNGNWTGNSIPEYVITLKEDFSQEIRDLNDILTTVEENCENESAADVYRSVFIKALIDKVNTLIALHPGEVEPFSFEFTPAQGMSLVNYKSIKPSLEFTDMGVTFRNGGGYGLVKFNKYINHFEATVTTPIANSVGVMIATDGQKKNGIGFFINPVGATNNKTYISTRTDMSWTTDNPGGTYVATTVNAGDRLVMDIADDGKVTVKINETLVWDDYVTNGVGGNATFNIPRLGLFTSWSKTTSFVFSDIVMTSKGI